MKKPELRALADAEDERAILYRIPRPLLHSERHDGKGLQWPGSAGHCGRGRLDTDVIGARHAATNTHSFALPRQAVVSGPIGHRPHEVVAHQRRDRPGEPLIQDFDNSFTHEPCQENAAVEQNVGWPRVLTAKKACQMTRDGRIGCVGKAKLSEAACLFLGLLVERRRRQKPLPQNTHDVGALQLRLYRFTDYTRATAQNCYGALRAFVLLSQQLLLGSPAMLIKGVELRPIQLGKALCNVMSQSGIDVVATKQDVIPHRNTAEREAARLFFNRDERKVGGAAPHVNHQDQGANRYLLAPIRSLRDPGIKCSLRLFQQDDILIPGFFGSLQG